MKLNRSNFVLLVFSGKYFAFQSIDIQIYKGILCGPLIFDKEFETIFIVSTFCLIIQSFQQKTGKYINPLKQLPIILSVGF
jgi:hypothetical protein